MRASSPVAELTGQTCTAPAARSDRMRDIVVAEAPHGPIRVLDLGCGTGSLVRRLADALPDATVMGIDISPANIEAARRTAGSADARVRFEVADYQQLAVEPFDVIVSDGVLHLVPGDTATLVAKLAHDTRPGGVFVCGMPFACAYNTAFALVRRLLRSVRGPWLDRLVLAAARGLHGRDMDDEGLRERVGYMYIPPVRVMDDGLVRAFAAAGLRRRIEYDTKSTSPSQLKHRVTVFEREARA